MWAGLAQSTAQPQPPAHETSSVWKLPCHLHISFFTAFLSKKGKKWRREKKKKERRSGIEKERSVNSQNWELQLLMGFCTSSVTARSRSEVAHDWFCSETQLLTSVTDIKQSERSSKEKTKKWRIMEPWRPPGSQSEPGGRSHALLSYWPS